MTDIHLQNWRNERGSELVKARAFIMDRNNSLTKISKETGIPLPSLKGYRSNPDKLKTAAWRRVNLLSQLADIKYIQSQISNDDMKDFMNRLAAFFDEEKSSFSDDLQTAVMLDKMKHIIMTDPLAVIELWKAFNQA